MALPLMPNSCIRANLYPGEPVSGRTCIRANLYPGEHAVAPGKSQAFSVEGDNAELRHYLARLGCQRRCFLRCLWALTRAVALFVYAWNRRQWAKRAFPKRSANVCDFIADLIWALPYVALLTNTPVCDILRVRCEIRARPPVYCHECGTANTVDSKYCKECGTKINDGFRTMMLSVNDLAVGQSEASLDSLTRLLDMAFWHNEAGNIEAAIKASESALAVNPNSTTAHSLLGTLYEKKGDDAQAILHFESVLALNPDSVADAAKLSQLRRGVHVKAVPPPVAQLWLPPVVMKLAPKVQQTWKVVSEPFENRAHSLPRQPLYAAGIAACVVLATGLLLTRPWARAEGVATYSVTRTASAPSPVAVDRSAFAGEPIPATAALAVKPWVMLGSTSTTPASTMPAYPVPALTAHDPFVGAPTYAPTRAAAPLWSLPPVTSHNRRVARRDLPALPLKLEAIPAPGSGEIAPAPVALSSASPLATVASIPQHTVVVSSLANGRASDNGAVHMADLPSHIHITVHQANSADAAPAAAGEDGSDVKADSYQQRALALQQQGDFRQARLAYQSAVRAYQSQIAAGQNVETAQRGLAACQTGLQICQQSQ